jgi:hypothetical protein
MPGWGNRRAIRSKGATDAIRGKGKGTVYANTNARARGWRPNLEAAAFLEADAFPI